MDWKTNNRAINAAMVDFREGLNKAFETKMPQYQPIGGGALTLDMPAVNHVLFDTRGPDYVRMMFFVRRCDEDNRIISREFAETGSAMAWME